MRPRKLAFCNSENHTGEWIAYNEKRLEEDLESLLSRSGSKRSSKRPSSLPSGKSATSEKVRAKARLAELLAEKELVTKKKEQEAKTEEILLDIEIAKTRAKARVFAETENDIGDDNVGNKDNETHTSIIVQRANHQDVNVMVAGPSVAAPGICASEGANTARGGNRLTRISSRTASSSDRLYYLLQHTDGEPKDLISSCIYMQADEGYSRARQLLQQEYGDPYKVSLAYLKQLNEWKPIKPDEGKCLKRYSHYLLKCFSAMQTLTHLAVLDHAPNLQVVVQKLPSYLQNKLREKATNRRHLENRSSCYGDIGPVCY
ncbi:uncharacterized protein [Palaemon carinicauda]|uniref:uncharacterized protein n=1 Tax=Palaemon carinicauda TaxID=392227 RepID=UPI0035B62881